MDQFGPRGGDESLTTERGQSNSIWTVARIQLAAAAAALTIAMVTARISWTAASVRRSAPFSRSRCGEADEGADARADRNRDEGADAAEEEADHRADARRR
ncbi:hypothetical protein ACLMAL_17925 [Nocardia sp. CWNU-33]|uniref:hypothetical protein n=1 Tax=Nocardia sp. CWNU-33 TaxID=3392117 RepID=UPI00398E8AF9